MAKLDYEKLLGGYATGALSQDEQQALFEAALHDQTLFNALADEQALKELLDDPPSRRRLVAALEALEEAEGKPSRWGALVPAWIPLPATGQSARRDPDRLYVSAPRQPLPKPRSWRGALAGGLILSALAMIVAAGLIEEMTSPPQPVLTADARHTDEALPPAARPNPVLPPAPAPPASQALEAPAIESQDNPSVPEGRVTVMADQPMRKDLPDPFRRKRDESRASSSEPKRELAPASPRPSPVPASPEMHGATKSDSLSESPTEQSVGGRQESVGFVEGPVLSAKAQFHAGFGSGDLGRDEARGDRVMEARKTEPSRFTMTPRVAEESPGATVPRANFGRAPQASVRPLGVRYSLIKKAAGGSYQEVSPESSLTRDDEARLTVEVNTSGYLYVLKRTPPEVWTVLYPNLGSVVDPAGRAAYVHSGTRYVIPSTGSLNEAAGHGPAQLVIIFGRDPQPELGSFGAVATDRESARAAKIQDLIRRIRNEIAGGKVLTERVDPQQEDSSTERAIYVVDRSPSPLTRLLSDITISVR